MAGEGGLPPCGLVCGEEALTDGVSEEVQLVAVNAAPQGATTSSVDWPELAEVTLTLVCIVVRNSTGFWAPTSCLKVGRPGRRPAYLQPDSPTAGVTRVYSDEIQVGSRSTYGQVACTCQVNPNGEVLCLWECATRLY